MAGSRFIALLRGINVGGKNSVPMAPLRDVCATLGWTDVTTYVNSGNVVFTAPGKAPSLEAALERAIEERFGLAIPVIVRGAAQWTKYVAGCPFREEGERDARFVMLALAKAKPNADSAAGLEARATMGERIVRSGDALWIYFAEGVGKSKLSPGLVDRIVGSPVTMRNWRTVVALGAMVRTS